MAEYDYLVLYLPRGTSRDTARRILTDHAEYGKWELAKLRLYADGSRKATLRRRIIRAVRTFLPPDAAQPGRAARLPCRPGDGPRTPAGAARGGAA
jgi:hypothetical protein